MPSAYRIAPIICLMIPNVNVKFVNCQFHEMLHLIFTDGSASMRQRIFSTAPTEARAQRQMAISNKLCNPIKSGISDNIDFCCLSMFCKSANLGWACSELTRWGELEWNALWVHFHGGYRILDICICTYMQRM